MDIISCGDAQIKGLTRYFTGIPCKHGHLSVRRTQDYHCVECIKIKNSKPDCMERKRAYALARWQSRQDVRDRQRKFRVEKQYNKTPKAVASRARWHKNKMQSDIQYAIRHNIKAKILRGINRGYRKNSTAELLGCSFEYLKFHIERQFKKGMSWNNRGNKSGQWSIDHIQPLASFDLCNPEQARAAWNYKNLQPLWHKENLAKSKRDPLMYARQCGLLI